MPLTQLGFILLRTKRADSYGQQYSVIASLLQTKPPFPPGMAPAHCETQHQTFLITKPTHRTTWQRLVHTLSRGHYILSITTTTAPLTTKQIRPHTLINWHRFRTTGTQALPINPTAQPFNLTGWIRGIQTDIQKHNSTLPA